VTPIQRGTRVAQDCMRASIAAADLFFALTQDR